MYQQKCIQLAYVVNRFKPVKDSSKLVRYFVCAGRHCLHADKDTNSGKVYSLIPIRTCHWVVQVSVSDEERASLGYFLKHSEHVLRTQKNLRLIRKPGRKDARSTMGGFHFRSSVFIPKLLLSHVNNDAQHSSIT